MCENLEFISVVPIQAILSPEPYESLIVLYDLISLGLGESLSGRQPGESNIVAEPESDRAGVSNMLAASESDGCRQRDESMPEGGVCTALPMSLVGDFVSGAPPGV